MMSVYIKVHFDHLSILTIPVYFDRFTLFRPFYFILTVSGPSCRYAAVTEAARNESERAVSNVEESGARRGALFELRDRFLFDH